MVERILKDINTLTMRLKHEKSKNNIFVLYASLLTMRNLLERISEEEVDINFPFDESSVEEIYFERIIKARNKYYEYLMSTLPANIVLADGIRDIMSEKGYFVKPTVASKRINDVKSAEYLIDFMKFMGSDVLKTFLKVYNEDRIIVYEHPKYGGTCVQASAINSSYITYMPDGTYHDNATIAHEIGHVIHDKLRYERGIRVLEDYTYIECLSTYMELAYHEYITGLCKDAFTLDELNLRNIREFISTIDIFDILTQVGLCAVTPDYRCISLIDDFDKIQSLFPDDIDTDYYKSIFKSVDYSETSKYFIGNVIASKFIYEYKDDLRKGLKELKNFLCTAHLNEYIKGLESIDIDGENFDFMDYQISKSKNLVFGRKM